MARPLFLLLAAGPTAAADATAASAALEMSHASVEWAPGGVHALTQAGVNTAARCAERAVRALRGGGRDQRLAAGAYTGPFFSSI